MKKLGILSMVLLLFLLTGLISCGKAPTVTLPTKPTTPTSPATPTAPTAAPIKPIKIRFSYSTPPTGWTAVRFLNPWGKKLEEVTNGRLKVDQYPGESLHPHLQGYDSVRTGITDITWVVSAYNQGTFPLSDTVGLPFLNLSEGIVDGKKVGGGEINSLMWQELLETVPEIQAEWSQIKTLFGFRPSPFLIFTAKKPVRNMNDMKGLKILSSGGPPGDMLRALGAVPVNVAPADFYSTLEKGTADGHNFAWAGVESYREFEVLHYWTDMPTTSGVYILGMNLAKWNSIPADIQKQMMSVSGMYGARYSAEAWPADEKDIILGAALKTGYKMERVALDPGERDKWIEIAGKPIWAKYVAANEAKGLAGQKVLDEALRLIKKYQIP